MKWDPNGHWSFDLYMIDHPSYYEMPSFINDHYWSMSISWPLPVWQLRVYLIPLGNVCLIRGLGSWTWGDNLCSQKSHLGAIACKWRSSRPLFKGYQPPPLSTMVTNTLGKLSPVKPMSSGQSVVQHLLTIFKGVPTGHRVGCWPPVFIVWEHGSWALEAFEEGDGLDVRGG